MNSLQTLLIYVKNRQFTTSFKASPQELHIDFPRPNSREPGPQVHSYSREQSKHQYYTRVRRLKFDHNTLRLSNSYLKQFICISFVLYTPNLCASRGESGAICVYTDNLPLYCTHHSQVTQTFSLIPKI